MRARALTVLLVSAFAIAQAGVASRAYAQADEWLRAPEQSTGNAPPVVHDLFAPQELPVVKEPPRNGMFYPPEDPTVKAPPTVHEMTLHELDARFRSSIASRPGMEQSPYFEQLLNSNRFTPEQATELTKDRTVLTFDKAYGSQIEYTSTDESRTCGFRATRSFFAASGTSATKKSALLKGQIGLCRRRPGSASIMARAIRNVRMPVCTKHGCSKAAPATSLIWLDGKLCRLFSATNARHWTTC